MEKHITDIQLTSLMDGEARGEEKESIESHLERCPFCRARFEEMVTLKKVLHSSMPPVLYEKEGYVWRRLERAIAAKKCPLRPENFVWPGALAILYTIITGVITLVMASNMAALLGLDVPMLDWIPGVWSFLSKAIVTATFGTPGTIISFAEDFPGASIWLGIALEITVQIVLIGGIAGLYVAWISSLGSNVNQMRRS